jgi:hypothetical protein
LESESAKGSRGREWGCETPENLHQMFAFRKSAESCQITGSGEVACILMRRLSGNACYLVFLCDCFKEAGDRFHALLFINSD